MSFNDFEPHISIIITARNEEQFIDQCLESILKLDYPRSKIEFLISDDHSFDNTKSIIDQFIKNNNFGKRIDIEEKKYPLNGKANALIQLAANANGEFLFFTDADVEVPKTWIRSILPYFNDNVGIVTGNTVPKSVNLFEEFQALDWVHNQGLLYVFDQFKIPLTTMGNNMAIRKVLYDQIGGYEGTKLSLTEDYELFSNAININAKFVNCLDTNVIAITNPMSTIKEWISQRKRWMHGALCLPLYIQYPLILRQYWMGINIILMMINFKIGFSLFLIKIVIDFVTYRRYQKNNFLKISIYSFLIFDVYNFIMSVFLGFSFLKSPKTTWKGRTY